LWILAALAVVSAIWALAVASSTSSVGQAAWPLICWLSLAALYGARTARRFALPLAMLYFALPVWMPLTNYVLWPLTIHVAGNIVGLLRLNAYVDDNFVTIPSGSFEIITGCSGQHFFLVASIVGVLIGHLNRLRAREFAIVLATAIAAALVSNWVRVVAIILIGYATEMRHPFVADGHLMFGWYVFAVSIGLYCLWARSYVGRIDDTAVREELPLGDARRVAGAARLLSAVAAILLAAGLGPVWAAVGSAVAVAKSRVTSPDRFRLPESHSRWIGPFVADTEIRPQFVGAVAERDGAYRSDVDTDQVVFAHSNLYLIQRQGTELVGYQNALFPQVTGRTSAVDGELAGGSWFAPHFRQIRVSDRSGTSWVLRYSYIVNGRMLASEWESKIALGIATLALRSPRAGLVMLSTRCGQDCTRAAQSVDSAWQVLSPPLRDLFVEDVAE
jgi:exosortase